MAARQKTARNRYGIDEKSGRPLKPREARIDLNHRLHSLEIAYKEFEDPTYAWEALDLALDADAEIPKWVTHYLRRCAAPVGRAVEEFSSKTKESWSPSSVARWFGFAIRERGRRHVISDRASRERSLEICVRVVNWRIEALRSRGKRLSANVAISEVAHKLGMSDRSVRRSYDAGLEYLDFAFKSGVDPAQ